MKKTLLTIAIVLGLGLAGFAQGGVFNRGSVPETRDGGADNPMMPSAHGANTDFGGDGTGTEQPTPLGTGIAVLAALGGAYLIGKKRREE